MVLLFPYVVVDQTGLHFMRTACCLHLFQVTGRVRAVLNHHNKGNKLMGKTHRGKGLWHLPARGRMTCPICQATRVKVLYERTDPEGVVVKVCKRCRRKPFPELEPETARDLLKEIQRV